MRFALIAVVTLTFVGCAPEAAQQLPTAPSPVVASTPVPPVPPAPDPPARPAELTFVWVIVLDDGRVSGTCIPGARVEIVRGQGLGRSLTQSTLGCDIWDPDYDAIFRGLNVGEELTLRGSAPGYAAKEKTVVPTPGGQFAVQIVLSTIQ
jgi:hypothetical protein